MVYLGRVGTGFSEADIALFLKLFKKHVCKTPPVEVPKSIYRHNPVWLEPELVAEIEFLELTKELKLRAPVFKRLRLDKPAKECVLEKH